MRGNGEHARVFRFQRRALIHREGLAAITAIRATIRRRGERASARCRGGSGRAEGDDAAAEHERGAEMDVEQHEGDAALAIVRQDCARSAHRRTAGPPPRRGSANGQSEPILCCGESAAELVRANTA